MLFETLYYPLAWTSVAFALLIFRVFLCLPAKFQCQNNKQPISTMVIWGSGGHTTEMMLLLSTMNTDSFHPMFHVIAETDKTTKSKLESSKHRLVDHGRWFSIIRSREVKQSWISTIFTTMASSLQCFYLTFRLRPKLIICNGPGTCVPICFAAFALKVFAISNTTIVFVESFCRVEKPSLTGRLLYPIADRFIVQWPQLLKLCPRAEYLGNLK